MLTDVHSGRYISIGCDTQYLQKPVGKNPDHTGRLLRLGCLDEFSIVKGIGIYVMFF